MKKYVYINIYFARLKNIRMEIFEQKKKQKAFNQFSEINGMIDKWIIEQLQSHASQHKGYACDVVVAHVCLHVDKSWANWTIV